MVLLLKVINMKIVHTVVFAAFVTTLLTATSPAAAHAVSGTVVGVFSNPVLTGNTIDGATGVPSPLDNTGTAAISGIGTSSFLAYPVDTLGHYR